MSDQPTIITPRLLLRPWRNSDLPAFAAMNADPRVMEFLPKVLTRDESDALAARIRKHFAQKGFGLWAVEAPGRAEFIGFVGLATATFPAHFTSSVEVGWRLAFAHWGKGYATEGASAAIRLGLDRFALKEIVSFTVPANTRSRRVMEKLGMTHSSADDFDHPGLPEGHRLRRHVLYRLRFDPNPLPREATAADVDAMFDIRTSVWENLLNEEQMRQRGITRESVAAGLRSNLKGWIVEQDGRAVGFSLAERDTSSIFALFVRPEFERRGFGSALLEAAVNWLRSQGKERIALDTGARSYAVEFYEKRGWKKVKLLKSGEWHMELVSDRALRQSVATPTPFPAQSSVLDERELLRQVVPLYDLPTASSCRFLTRGDSDVYRIATSTGDYYLKIRRPSEDKSRCEIEARWVMDLAREGLPVVRPIALKKGNGYAIELDASEGKRGVLVFEAAPPPLKGPLGQHQARQLGQLLAQVHAASERSSASVSLPEVDYSALKTAVAEVMNAVALSEAQRETMVRAAEFVIGRYARLSRAHDEHGAIHGDLALSNLRLEIDGRLALFDFGAGCRDWRLNELLNVWHRTIPQEPVQLRTACWEEFQEGYAAIRAVPAALEEFKPVWLIASKLKSMGYICNELTLRRGIEPIEEFQIVSQVEEMGHMLAESEAV